VRRRRPLRHALYDHPVACAVALADSVRRPALTTRGIVPFLPSIVSMASSSASRNFSHWRCAILACRQDGMGAMEFLVPALPSLGGGLGKPGAAGAPR